MKRRSSKNQLIEISLDDILESQFNQIDVLREELFLLKQQNNNILQLIKEDREETNKIKLSIHNLVNLIKQNNHITNPIQLSNKHFQVKDIHPDQIYTIIELKDQRIVTGSADGTICISNIDYENKKWQVRIKHQKAHEGKIRSLSELNKKRIVSCGTDKLINIWDYSQKNALLHIHTLKGHTGGVYKVINLTQERIASCSFEDHTVRIWEGEQPFNLIHTYQQLRGTNSIIQLMKRYEVICINSSIKNGGYLIFYDLFSPYIKRGIIEGVMTNNPNGLIELYNGDVAVSKGCFPTPTIYIIDPVRYIKISEITNSEYILDYGALSPRGKDSFVYVHHNYFCEISKIDEEYKIVFKHKVQKEKLYGANSLILTNRGEYLMVPNGHKGINVIKYST